VLAAKGQRFAGAHRSPPAPNGAASLRTLSLRGPTARPCRGVGPMLYLQMEAAMVALKVEQVGDSVAVLLPQDTLAALHVTPGDILYLTEAPDGYRVTAFDPEFERLMAIARDIMAEDRNFLRELARQ